mmetsp:Transcript_30497/g.68390  ORF Transcript_30497/g.68390 Transcript_30497/m.68390 type:complete len:316 (+) Transcript_30497:61-1008(+)|eukprot:CAMPEP_0172609600 /NCGR_PEP_ID=MMETSP1068-20121228/29573_1 /TAXON_ID=35684 /ORGANISM="Pseudopedinella elastica, Strain CCMP716" /LENGTH=315 /DNA_ID=CAMNT_0013413159 /DNA_START=44 /DNA_END=991 /DNA_ORIENTATION=-
MIRRAGPEMTLAVALFLCVATGFGPLATGFVTPSFAKPLVSPHSCPALRPLNRDAGPGSHLLRSAATEEEAEAAATKAAETEAAATEEAPDWWTEDAQAKAADLAAQQAAEVAGEESEASEVGLAPDDPNARSGWSKEDFIKTEWKIAIQWEDSKKITETWIRFVDDFELEWGLNAKGSWGLEGQYLTFSRDFSFGWGGKRIYGAKLTRKQNEVYIDGIVRGWTPLMPANNLGQFQAMRLGVDRAPFGAPYWNTPEWGEEREREAAARRQELEEAEPVEPFWTGIADAAGQLKETLAPPGSKTAQAIEEATKDRD